MKFGDTVLIQGVIIGEFKTTGDVQVRIPGADGIHSIRIARDKCYVHPLSQPVEPMTKEEQIKKAKAEGF